MHLSKNVLIFSVLVLVAVGFATRHYYEKLPLGKHSFASRPKKIPKQESFKASVTSSELTENRETNISFTELSKEISKTQQTDFIPGFEWLKPLALSMNIDLFTAKHFQEEALQKLADGSLQTEDLEPFIRQRLDNYDLANDNAELPESESDWVAQNTN
jgi:hypothetical protein